MLIKQADDQSAHLSDLDEVAKGTGPRAKQAALEVRLRRAGIRGEEQAAYLIDFDYASSANWAVIHDLRLEHGSRVAQIDHLLINRWMDLYVLETKAFSGVKITEEGEYLRWNAYRKTYEGMASPVEQNERHVQVLRDVFETMALPTRLGLRIFPSFQSFVLISPTAKIYRPRKHDTSRVIKADQLKKAIWRDIDNENGVLTMLKTAAKIVSSDTVESVARQLAALHRPLRKPAANAVAGTITPVVAAAPEAAPPAHARRRRIEPTFSDAQAPRASAATMALTPPVDSQVVCKSCQSAKGSVLSGKYGYYFKCLDCSGNTAIRFTCQPGHTPRVRKERDAFYRDCADCDTSAVFHRNPAGGVG